MHRYGIITTLPFSKYASPIFAQRKPNGKLRLLVDLRKINALIFYDYINNNHPVSTLSDATEHLAGKKPFCKLDCSQAYHFLQMADQRSIEMLAFNFASRTFAYKRLAQGLSRALSLSAFSSFMREYLDKVIKADQCAQNVDDIGIAANSATQLIRNIRAVFECIRQAGLKRGRIPKKNDYPTRNRPSRPQNTEILSKCTFPEIKETSTEIHRLCQLLPQLHSTVVRKTTRFLRATESRQTNQGHRRITRPLQSNQRSPTGGMWIGPQTTNHRSTIRPNDGC